MADKPELRVEDMPHLVRPGMPPDQRERAISQNFEHISAQLRKVNRAFDSLSGPSEFEDAETPEGIVTTFFARKTKRKKNYGVHVRFTAPTDSRVVEAVVQAQYVTSGGVAVELDSDSNTTLHRKRVEAPIEEDAAEFWKATFYPLQKPRFWYVRFRVRFRTQSGWFGEASAWTTPEKPYDEVTQTGSGTVTNVSHKHNLPGVHVWTWPEPETEDINVDQYHVIVEVKDDNGTWREVDNVYKRSRHHRYEAPKEDRGHQHRATIYVVDEDGNEGSASTPVAVDDNALIPGPDIAPGTINDQIGFGPGVLHTDSTISLESLAATGFQNGILVQAGRFFMTGGTSSKTCTWPVGKTKAGNLLIAVVVAGDGRTLNATGVGAAPWSNCGGSSQTWDAADHIMYVRKIEGSASRTSETVTLSGNGHAVIFLFEFQGIEAVAAEDKSVQGSFTNDTTPEIDIASALTVADEMVLVITGFNYANPALADASGPLDATPNPPEYTHVTTPGNVLDPEELWAQAWYRDVSVTTAPTVDLFTVGTAGVTGVARIITFKRAASAATLPTPDVPRVGIYAKENPSAGASDESKLAYKDDMGLEHILHGFFGCRTYKNATQQVNAGNTDAIQWQVDAFDIGSVHNTGTNNGQRFVAPVGGYYQFYVKVTIDGDLTNHASRCDLRIRSNSAGSDASGTLLSHAEVMGHTAAWSIQCEWTGFLQEGDYLEAFFFSPGASEARILQSGEAESAATFRLVGIA